jgi:hypothetical protein
MKKIQVATSDEFHRLLKSEAAKIGLDISEVVRRMTYKWLMNPEPLDDEAYDKNFVLGYDNKTVK